MCQAKEELYVYAVPPGNTGELKDSVHLCNTCKSDIKDTEGADINHWRCLYESMWSEVLPIQIISYRMLYRLRDHGWPTELLETMYLDEADLEWAKSTEEDEFALKHFDSNGVRLKTGDNVVLIKDLVVKGANFTAKRGTAVRRITLDSNNEKYVEGKVNGQNIVLLTDYIKKQKD